MKQVAKRIFEIIGGILLIIAGIILWLLPVLPGAFLIVPGIFLISPYHGRRMWAKIKAWKQKHIDSRFKRSNNQK